MEKKWTASDIKSAKYLGEIEIDGGGNFSVVATDEKIIFGGACNAGLLESGYIEREDGESLDETLRELVEDLEIFYRDGSRYTSRIAVNERM